MLSIEDAVENRGCDLNGCETCPYAAFEESDKACLLKGGHAALVQGAKLGKAIGWEEAETFAWNVMNDVEDTGKGYDLYPDYIVPVLRDQLFNLLELLKRDWLLEGGWMRPDKVELILETFPEAVAAYPGLEAAQYSMVDLETNLSLVYHLLSKAAGLSLGVEIGAYS